jgi:hypothetical protein
MNRVTTTRIVAEKSLQATCGQQCVDWAIFMIEQGCDNQYVLRLASMLPPHNHFEIADLTDRALNDLGIAPVSPSDASIAYAVELFRCALDGEVDMLTALTEVKELCIANDYLRDLMDFYLLYFAHSDLQDNDVQWYWDGATKQNVLSIVRERATVFINKYGK